MKLLLNDICKAYKLQHGLIKNVLNHFSYQFESGNIYLLCGESGCGKTTLLNTISLISQIDSGDILIDHQSIRNLNIKQQNWYRKEIVSYAPQKSFFIEDKNVLENINQLSIYDKKKVNYYSEKLEIKHLYYHKVKSLSGGEKQRLNLLLAILKPCHILLLDEPTSSLDDAISVKFLELLKDMKRDKIIVITSHNIELVKNYVDEIVEVYEHFYKKLDTRQNSKLDLKAIPESMNLKYKHQIKFNKISIFTFILSIFLMVVISSKMFIFDKIDKEVRNYPTINQFIIPRQHINNVETKQYFPLGKTISQPLFQKKEYMINNVSIYLFQEKVSSKKIKKNHIIISEQLANIIANKENMNSIYDLINKKINVCLYKGKDENLNKEFIIQDIITTGDSMVVKDVYCLYSDVLSFYSIYNLKSVLNSYKYDIVFCKQNCIEIYSRYRSKGAYSQTLENILMNNQLMSMFNVCFYSIILFIFIIFSLFIFSILRNDFQKRYNYFFRLILLGYSYKQLLFDEYIIELENIIISSLIVFIFLLLTSLTSVIIFILILFCIIISITIQFYIIYKNIEYKGLDYIIKNY